MAQKFSETFKIECVDKALNSGKSIAKVAREESLSYMTLRSWIKKYGGKEKTSNPAVAEFAGESTKFSGIVSQRREEELERLRWRVKELENEREDLKEAVRFMVDCLFEEPSPRYR